MQGNLQSLPAQQRAQAGFGGPLLGSRVWRLSSSISGDSLKTLNPPEFPPFSNPKLKNVYSDYHYYHVYLQQLTFYNKPFCFHPIVYKHPLDHLSLKAFSN